MKAEPQVAARLRDKNRVDMAVPQPVVAVIAYGIERFGAIKAALERKGQRIEDPS
jgi:hypothetical protein